MQQLTYVKKRQRTPVKHPQDSHDPENPPRAEGGALPMAVVALRLLFRLSGAVAPALAARFASYLWFRPQRHRPPAREQALLERAQYAPMHHAGKRVAVYHWGKGPTVMLVHGWSGRGAQLGELVGPLVAAGYRVVAFDAPAHGRSDGRDTTLPEISEAILRLVSDFSPAHAVIAHSFGVPCVLFALQQQGFARRVVAFSTPATLEGLVEKFSGTLALSPRTVQSLRYMLVRRFGEDIWTRFSAQNMAQRTGLPALVIHDRDDRDIPWQEGEAVASAWPQARFLRTEGLGHRRILRDPEVIDRVVRFLVDSGSDVK
jgi:pimeloyl-ACP methyl ester carboxylesterase